MLQNICKSFTFFAIMFPLFLTTANCSSLTCPDFTHLVTTEGTQSEAPEGFFIYGIYGQNGVFISKIRQYSPVVLPYTKSDTPTDMAISSNGKWVLFNSGGIPYLTRLSPGCKVKIPIATSNSSYTCFWRNQPNGEDAICYMVNLSTIRAITAQFTRDTVVFGNDRVIVSLGDSLQIWPGLRLCVSSDQLFSAIHPLVNGSFAAWQSVYLTLPQNGLGIATGANMYKWADSAFIPRAGCGHAMSWDGSLCAADVGKMSTSACLPHEHKGFTITPFWSDTSAPQVMEHSVDEHAISINWCPERFRFGSAVEQNFWDWYFGNSNDYIIGNQRGDLADMHGIWLVRWHDNNWTFLTDPAAKIEAYQPAVHFCSMDTVQVDTAQVGETTAAADPNNPSYKVVSPNGGETFLYGDTLHLVVSCKKHGNIIIRLSTNGGISYQEAYGKAVDPLTDTLILIPLTPDVVTADTSLQNDSCLNALQFAKCLVRIQDYGNGSYFDVSDSFFSIKGRDFISEEPLVDSSKGSGCGRGFSLAFLPLIALRSRYYWGRRFGLRKTGSCKK